MGNSQRNVFLGAVALVMLGVAAYLYFWRSGARAELPSEARVYAVCLACKEEVQARHPAREIAPFVCPQCGERAVYGWKYCRDCKKRFVPGLVRYPDEEFPRLPAIPVCPACGSNRTAGYSPNNPRQEPIGDAPLPDWPVP